MITGIVCVAFVLIVIGVCITWKTTTKIENVFSVVCIVIGFTVLLLRSMEFTLPDPTDYLFALLLSLGLAQ